MKEKRRKREENERRIFDICNFVRHLTTTLLCLLVLIHSFSLAFFVSVLFFVHLLFDFSTCITRFLSGGSVFLASLPYYEFPNN